MGDLGKSGYLIIAANDRLCPRHRHQSAMDGGLSARSHDLGGSGGLQLRMRNSSSANLVALQRNVSSQNLGQMSRVVSSQDLSKLSELVIKCGLQRVSWP